MSDRHNNIFYFFRGPSRMVDSATEMRDGFDAQIEDNTTKALINLLEHGEPALTTSFLQEFVPGAAAGADEKRRYYLQAGPPKLSEPSWLLGISAGGTLDPAPPAVRVAAGSRIDAAIHLPGSALVAIEVKLDEHLDRLQLDRHAERWRVPARTHRLGWTDGGRWRLAAWRDVYRWAAASSERTTDPVSGFLLTQFTEYLRLVGLAPFAGFDVDHFQWLSTEDAEWRRRNMDLHASIRSGLNGMWNEVRDGLDVDLRQYAEPIHLNQLALDATAAVSKTTTRWGDKGVTVTIELAHSKDEEEGNELQVNVVGWNASQANAFKTWLAPPPDGRVRSVSGIPGLEDVELAVFRRYPKDQSKREKAGSRPVWRREDYASVCRRPVALLAGEPIAELEAEWRQDDDPRWEKLAFNLRRAWPQAKVVASGPEIVTKVTPTIQAFLRLLSQINDPA